MHTFVRSLSHRELTFVQLPMAAGSMMIAELAYKFGSFTLEAMAFLVTWFVIDLASRKLRTGVRGATRARSRTDIRQ